MKYRSEIDGLRAIAVVPVILFHAGFEIFSGGFVGVDVFFVISGYLITTIIINEMDEGKFSLLNFYERRARRILPALFFVVLCCLPFAWFLLMPSDMKDFSQSLVAVATFSSNILFWRESGYFDTAAELKPLLHTWSLAVEEQFYILFPLFLMAAWRFGKRAIVWTLVAAFVTSLATAQWGAYNKPAATFYLLPTRAWELLIGSFAAFYLQKRSVTAPLWVSNVLSAVGLAAISFGVFAFDDATPFPSVYALAPTVGTVLIILFAVRGTAVNSLLSMRGFVGVGLISYSLYLWHQPVFAFWRYFFMSEIEMVSFLLLFGAVVCLSIFSYSFIETPMRQARIRQSITFVFSLGSLAVLALVGCIVMFNNSFPNRFAEYVKANIWSDIHKCHGASRISELEDYLLECLQDSSSSPTVYLLGDSHAHQLIFPIRSISAQFSFNVNFLNTENWSMFPHNLISGQFDGSDEVFTRLTDNLSSDDIIFIAFHRGHFNSVRDQHIPIHETVVENDEENNFISNFYKANDFFERMGVSVILILDAPLLPDSVLIERCYNIRALRSACNIDLRQDLHTRQRQQRAAEHLANSFENVHIFDAALPLYANGSFSPITNDRQYLMFDRHHLTELGSMYLRESLSRFFYENLITWKRRCKIRPR